MQVSNVLSGGCINLRRPGHSGSYCLYLFCVVIFVGECLGQTIISDLNSGWRFRKVGDSTWMKATVPGTIHTDLLSNEKIADPFFGSNEQHLQWIDTCNWEYEL